MFGGVAIVVGGVEFISVVVSVGSGGELVTVYISISIKERTNTSPSGRLLSSAKLTGSYQRIRLKISKLLLLKFQVRNEKLINWVAGTNISKKK